MITDASPHIDLWDENPLRRSVGVHVCHCRPDPEAADCPPRFGVRDGETIFTLSREEAVAAALVQIAAELRAIRLALTREPTP
jgi:hypothetical protein